MNLDSKILKLSDRKIGSSKLVTILESYPNLLYLDLSFSNIKEYNVMNSDGTKYYKLKYLNLSRNEITNFRFNTQFGNLEILNLSNNLINTFFAKSLCSLVILDLSYNDLKQFPLNVCNFPKLESLDVSNNKFSGELVVMTAYDKLKKCNFSNNNITNLKFLHELNCLTDLNVSHNKISNVNCLPKSKSLRKLDISYNELNNFNIKRQLNKLRILKLNNNILINFLSDNLFPILKYLDLSDNYLEGNIKIYIPESLAVLNIKNNQTHLNKLYLYNDSFTNIRLADFSGSNNIAKSLILKGTNIFNMVEKESNKRLKQDNKEIEIINKVYSY